MMESGVRTEIDARLDEIERTENVRIVFACESGSRACGFASPDSDYDVRFIYVRPRDWYLSIDVENRRDVIERPVTAQWDVNGWDVRKALRLMHKSNPPLLEWLGSPIVYRELAEPTALLRSAVPDQYDPTACAYHYFQMAKGNHREYLGGDTVRLKKYLYVLRPVAAVRWIEAGLGVVPTEFDRLLDGTIADRPLRSAIDDLLELKKGAGELHDGPRIPLIGDFLSAELERMAGGLKLPERRRPADGCNLNDVFRRIVDGFAPQP